VSGTVAAGFTSVSFLPLTGFTGTIDGATVDANSAINFEADAGAVLEAIPYTVTAGSLTIFTGA
jgi:hypothetical protein